MRLVIPVLMSVLIYDLQQVVVQNMSKQLLKYYYVSGLILILLNSRGQHQLSSLLEQFQNLKIGDIVVTKVISSKQNRVNPVTNIDRGKLKLHIGRSGKWRSYSQFEVLTADYVVKWIKRRIDSKSSPHFTIEIKSDTEVIFKVHKKVQFNQ